MRSSSSYALVTAAYNEQALIEQTISSMVSQTVRPAKWIIVSDGSTDGTDDIVRRYSGEYDFIELCRISEDHPRNFTAQVYAINRGLSLLGNRDYTFIGNMDADITLEPDYFSRLLDKFGQDPGLGLGGGSIWEKSGDSSFKPRRGNSVASVAHACQLFRRECFDAIGGAYLPLPYGGPDTHAEIMARMKHWRVASFTDLKVFHHRRTGSVGGVLRGLFRQGKMDYSLGALPLFEFVKLLRRVRFRPYLLGSITRLAGFLDSYWRREERAVPKEVEQYCRSEQRQRLARFFRMRSDVSGTGDSGLHGRLLKNDHRP
jgi:glycosyltransferase involved in cell wall biosynthesis